MPKLRIVRFVTNIDKRQPDIAKVVKILEWLDYQNKTKARGFLKVIGFYCAQIKAYNKRAKSITRLFKKNTPFEQGDK